MTIYRLDVLPILNQSVVPCPVLSVTSWPAYRFLRSQVRWSSIPISLRIFCSLLWFTQSKALVQSMKQNRCFSVILLLFLWSNGCWQNLISVSSAFFKSLLNIWEFSVHELLKPSLENFEHYLACLWAECNCVVVWTFFGIAFLWDWNEKWSFPVFMMCNYDNF